MPGKDETFWKAIERLRANRIIAFQWRRADIRPHLEKLGFSPNSINTIPSNQSVTLDGVEQGNYVKAGVAKPRAYRVGRGLFQLIGDSDSLLAIAPPLIAERRSSPLLANAEPDRKRTRPLRTGRIHSRSADEIRQVIRDSNERSAQGRQKYVESEILALHSDYEFITCPCRDDCWCKRNACAGHYRLKDVTFDEFLKTYVNLWIPPRARENVKRAVLGGNPFNGRQRNAIKPLQRLRENWSSILDKVRGYDKCGLCDSTVPLVANVSNLYEGKMWSQLFYDSLVPFDTASRILIKRAGYPDPKRNFLAMNGQLFSDIRRLSEAYGLEVPGVRQLDSPYRLFPTLRVPAGGQPLSRVVDKIFYSPGERKVYRHRAAPSPGAISLSR